MNPILIYAFNEVWLRRMFLTLSHCLLLCLALTLVGCDTTTSTSHLPRAIIKSEQQQTSHSSAADSPIVDHSKPAVPNSSADSLSKNSPGSLPGSLKLKSPPADLIPAVAEIKKPGNDKNTVNSVLSDVRKTKSDQLPTMLLAEDIVIANKEPFRKPQPASPPKTTVDTANAANVSQAAPSVNAASPPDTQEQKPILMAPRNNGKGLLSRTLSSKLMSPIRIKSNPTASEPSNDSTLASEAFLPEVVVSVKGIIAGPQTTLALLMDQAGNTQTVKVGDVASIMALPARVIRITSRTVVLEELGSHKKQYLSITNIVGYRPTGDASVAARSTRPASSSGSDATLKMNGASNPSMTIQPVADKP